MTIGIKLITTYDLATKIEELLRLSVGFNVLIMTKLRFHYLIVILNKFHRTLFLRCSRMNHRKHLISIIAYWILPIRTQVLF